MRLTYFQFSSVQLLRKRQGALAVECSARPSEVGTLTQSLLCLSSINNLGILLQDQGDLATAELLLREALELRRETKGLTR